MMELADAPDFVYVTTAYLYRRELKCQGDFMSVAYGNKIKVGNGSLNVYTEGNGTHTIVILSGAGVTSPVLEYKPLYQKLSDTYKIAVVEKSGYGMSESTGIARSVQNMVNESREALLGAGIKPPYILAAHSYSGFEAIYWANTFTEEVSAVLSIDMGIPETAFEMEKALPPNKRTAMMNRTKKLYAKIQKKGFLARLLKNFTVNTSGMLSSDYLNNDEKELYEELFYKNLTNDEIFEENIMMTANAKAAAATGHLKVPSFFYISDMKTPLKHGSWREFGINYAQSIGAEYKLTDKGHLMYSKIPEQMAADFKSFLKNVIK